MTFWSEKIWCMAGVYSYTGRDTSWVSCDLRGAEDCKWMNHIMALSRMNVDYRWQKVLTDVASTHTLRGVIWLWFRFWWTISLFLSPMDTAICFLALKFDSISEETIYCTPAPLLIDFLIVPTSHDDRLSSTLPRNLRTKEKVTLVTWGVYKRDGGNDDQNKRNLVKNAPFLGLICATAT